MSDVSYIPTVVTQVDPVNPCVVRGMTAVVNAVFYDVNGNPVQPASASVTINYLGPPASNPGQNERVSQTFAMSWNIATQSMQYAWDSSRAAGPCKAFFNVFTPAATQPAYAGQGVFEIVANPANLME